MKHFNIILRLMILAAVCCVGLLAPQEAQARSGEECPEPIVMPLCSWQSDINRAFARWKSDFDYDDCEISVDLDDLKPPKKCTGGTITVTLYDCDRSSDNCFSTFTVEVPPPPAAYCPADKEIGPCVANQAAVDAAFADWLDDFEIIQNCEVNLDKGGFTSTPVAPPFCGGSTTVTFMVRNRIDCYEPFTCTRTFTVKPTLPPVLICPMNRTEPACLSQAEVDSRFQSWLNEFRVDLTQSCPGTVGRFLTTPRAPGKCGGIVSVTFVATTPNGCATNSCTRTFEVLPDLIAPMGTCPPSQTGLTCLNEVPEPDAQGIADNYYTDNCGIVIGVLTSVQLDENDCDFTVTHNYRIYDDCGNYTPCSISYSGGDDEPPVGACPQGGQVATLNDVPAPDPDLAASGFVDNCGQVWARVVNTTQTGSPCVGFTITHNYMVGDQCGKDNDVPCSITWTVPANGDGPISGNCPAPVTGLQCWDDVPSAAQAKITMEGAFPGATVVHVGSTNINNYCDFSVAHAFSVTDPCTGQRTICILEYSGQDLTPPAPTNGGCPAGGAVATLPAPNPAAVAAGYTDNCSSVHAYLVGTNFSGFNITYHYRVYDDCDNSLLCSVSYSNSTVRPGTGSGTAAVEVTDLGMKAYPNPTSGELFLEFGEVAGQEAIVTLRNLYGQEVFTRNLTLDAGTQQLNLAAEGLSNGTYMLTVRTNSQYATQKIVLNR